MSLTVVTPAASFDLTTLPRVKIELKIGSTDTTYDSYLRVAIKEASSIMSHETNRTFAKQTYKEFCYGTNRNILSVKKFPIISLDKIVHQYEYGSLSGDWLSGGEDDAFVGIASTLSTVAYRIEDSEAGLVYKKSPWMKQSNVTQYIEAFAVDDGKQPYQITYKAGWVLPSTISSSSTAYPGARTLPYDLEQAAVTLVSAAYNRLGRDPMVKSEKTGDASQQLFDVPYGVKVITGLPHDVYRVIEKYKVNVNI